MKTFSLWNAALLIAPAIALPTAALAKEEHAEQQFLFVLDPAYVQAPDEFQAGVQLEFSPGEDIDFTAEAEVELGLTERLQIQAALPYIDGDGGAGIGDMSFGIAYAVLRESATTPSFSVVAEAIAPTGDADKGLGHDAWGFAAGASLSKQLTPGVFGHAVLEYERIDDALDEGAVADLSEWSVGIGLAALVSKRATLTLELAREHEREEFALVTEEEDTTIAAAGVAFRLSEAIEVGVGAVTRFSDGADHTSPTLRAIMEW